MPFTPVYNAKKKEKKKENFFILFSITANFIYISQYVTG